MTGVTVVGVLRGGPHTEHEASLRSGQSALTALPAERYHVKDIYIDTEGVWHYRGRAVSPGQILPSLDVALLLTTGSYASCGELQQLLEQFGIPYNGSRAMPAFTAAHGVLCREHARDRGLRVPRYRHADSEETTHAQVSEATRAFLPPVLVRAAAAHRNSTAQILTGYAPVRNAVTGLLAGNRGGVVIEEHVRGPRIRVGVLEHVRDQERYTLPPRIERDPLYPSHLLPQLTKQERADLEQLARDLHDSLGLRHHSESTFVQTPRGIVYLGTDPFPHLGPESSFGGALVGVGISAPELFSHLIDLASRDRKR